MSKGLDNLEIYKLAEGLEIKVYEATKLFPSNEKYRSVDQLRRLSSSVSNNIAEDYSRFSFDDKINKFYIARGEAEETKKEIERAAKKNFISKQLANKIIDGYTSLIKGVNGYIKFLYHRKETKEDLSAQMPKRPSNHFSNPQVLKYPSTSFTLIELIVSIGIITLVIITAVSIYLFVIGPQQKITATTNLQQDGQLIMNMIAKDIRQNRVDYSDYPCSNVCSCTTNNYLTLTDGTNKIKYIRCKVDVPTETCVSGPLCALKKCKATDCKNQNTCDTGFKDVTMRDISAEKFQVIICPGCDEMTGGGCGCNETCFRNPQVTIILELKSYKERVGERRIKLQGTIPQRYQEKSYY